MKSSTARERILLHLDHYDIYSDHQEVPIEVTQAGIADSVRMSRSHVSYETTRLVDEENLLRESVRRVKGLKRKRKVYFLTDRGLEEAKNLQELFKEKTIILQTQKEKKEIALKDVGEHIEGEYPILKALVKIDEDAVLDLRDGDVAKGSKDIFVGREGEMKKIKEAFQDVLKGKSRTVFVTGESGIGKTTLVSEFGMYVEEKGFEFLEGKAYFETAEPFLPFKKIFDDIHESILDSVDSNIEIFSFSGDSSPKIETEEIFESQRKATFFGAAKVIREAAKETPLVIFIDDLQWADGGTLKMIHYLSDNLSDSKVMLLGAFRPMETMDNEFLNEVHLRMKRERRFDSIELRSLNWLQVKELISETLGVKNVPSKFVHIMYDYCEGNPLFTEECINQLLDEDIVDPNKNRYPSSKDEFKVPDMLENILEHRFAQFSSSTKRVLECGSVIGEVIPFELLLRVMDMDDLELLDRIDVLLRTNLWSEGSDGDNFSFSHSLIKLAAYRRIPSIKRKKLHYLVANTLKETYSDEIEEYYSDIAIHLEKSENKEEAVEYYLLAGQQAERVYAHEEALEMYQKSFELVKRTSGIAEEEKILEKLADVHKLLGNYDTCLDHYQRSMESSKDKIHQQKMYRKMAETHLKRNSFKEAQSQLEKGLSLVDVLQESDLKIEEKCKLLKVKGWVWMLKGDHHRAEKIFEEEMTLAESLDDLEVVGEALHNLGTLSIRKGEFKEAESRLKKTIEYRKKADDEEGLAKTYNNIGAIYKAWDELDVALDYSRKSVEMHEKIGDDIGIAGGLRNIGNIYYLKGELEKAEDHHNRSLKLFEEMGNAMGIAMAKDNLGLVYRKRGDMERALYHHKEGLKLREEIGEHKGIALSSENIGMILKEKGELEEALDHYKRALRLFEKLGDRSKTALILTNIGDLFLYKGDIENSLDRYKKVEAMLDELEGSVKKPPIYLKLAECFLQKGEMKIARKYVMKAGERSEMKEKDRNRSDICRILGMIEAEEGDRKKSFEHLSRAKGFFSDTSGKGYARCLLEEGKLMMQEGDEKKAREVIREASQIFDELGFTYWKKICEGYLEGED